MKSPVKNSAPEKQGLFNANYEIKLSLLILISFFVHLIALISLVSPDLHSLIDLEKALRKKMSGGRDIIVNINQDDVRAVDKKTLLSDRDSRAKGYLTKELGDRWLNNSLDFRLLKGQRSKARKQRVKIDDKKNTILLTDESEVVVFLDKAEAAGEIGEGGIFDKILIPDKNDINRNNAIFYSNDGRFSFNTAKFKNFKYFRNMKDKIASNWHPPLMANAVIYGYDPLTGGYAPGRTRIMAIPSQEVILFFVMNRKGEVEHVQILDSLGHKSLDSSCLDAIRLSKTFGDVPEDIEGEKIVIPFIFGYYVR